MYISLTTKLDDHIFDHLVVLFFFVFCFSKCCFSFSKYVTFLYLENNLILFSERTIHYWYDDALLFWETWSHCYYRSAKRINHSLTTASLDLNRKSKEKQPTSKNPPLKANLTLTLRGKTESFLQAFCSTNNPKPTQPKQSAIRWVGILTTNLLGSPGDTQTQCQLFTMFRFWDM